MPFDRNLMTWEEYTKTEEYKKKQIEKAKQSYLRNKHVKYHCGHCNIDMENKSIFRHIKTKKHLKNYDEAKQMNCCYF